MQISVERDCETGLWTATSQNFPQLRVEAPSQIEIGKKLRSLIPKLTGKNPIQIDGPSPAELVALETRMKIAQSPEQLAALVNAAKRQYGSRLLYANRKFWIEGFVAAEFSTQTKKQFVRLCLTEKPDFEVSNDGDRWVRYECVEAGDFYTENHTTGRKRDAEYKCFWFLEDAFGVSITSTDIHGWGEADQLAENVLASCKSKVGGNYDKDISLIVRLNRTPWSRDSKVLYSMLQAATFPAGGKFQSVWVFVDGTYWRFWESGVAQPLPSFPPPDHTEDQRLFSEICLPKPGQAFDSVFED